MKSMKNVEKPVRKLTVKRDGKTEVIEVKGDVITYKDKRNKFTYRIRGLVDFLIID